MMQILSLGKRIEHSKLHITSIDLSALATHTNIGAYSYIIISGGDGTIRRVIHALKDLEHHAAFILNPIGSFNVVAKMHRTPKLETVLEALENGEAPKTQQHPYYKLNQEVFLFSAGNMGDLQHIFLSETLRFGLLKKGMSKYLLAFLFLLPLHLIITPFMLFSSNRFFIFTPASFIKKFGSFYGEVREMTIELEDSYNHLELDGDIVTIEARILHIRPAGTINIVI